MARDVSTAAVLGLFYEPERVADAIDGLRALGFGETDFEVLTPCPYPEGAFGTEPPENHMYVYPLIGAVLGIVVGGLLVVGTELTFPLVTGGKPLLSIPPILIILFEGSMLGAMVFTMLGFLFEARIPGGKKMPWDRRLVEGYLGLAMPRVDGRLEEAQRALVSAGAVDVITRRDG